MHLNFWIVLQKWPMRGTDLRKTVMHWADLRPFEVAVLALRDHQMPPGVARRLHARPSHLACRVYVRTGSWTGPPRGKRAPRIGISSTVFGVRGVRALRDHEIPPGVARRLHATPPHLPQVELGHMPGSQVCISHPSTHTLHPAPSAVQSPVPTPSNALYPPLARLVATSPPHLSPQRHLLTGRTRVHPT